MSRANVAEIIQIDNTWLPGIVEYDVTLEDIDGEGSTRAEDGTMHREVLRGKVFHASVTHMLTMEEAIDVSSLVYDEATIECQVFCPGKGEEAYTTINAYVSKLNTKLVWYEDPNGTAESWWQLSYQLVEV